MCTETKKRAILLAGQISPFSKLLHTSMCNVSYHAVLQVQILLSRRRRPRQEAAFWPSATCYSVMKSETRLKIRERVINVGNIQHHVRRFQSISLVYLWLNRKFVRTDDPPQDSEETATAFTVSQSSHNSRTKL